MKFLVVLLAVAATAYAALPTSEYLPPLDDASPTSNLDLQSLLEASPLADDGYRYKTVRRLRLRHRRDVNELANNDYLPPQAEPAVADIPVIAEEAAPAEAAQDSAVLADDGYRYKTVKRYRYRVRRDVNELANNEYLPPAEETQAEEAAPVEAAPAEAAQDSAVLADDGYRYKTVKRYRYRVRRDVNELANNDYLPPAEETQAEEAAPVEAAPAEAAQDSAVLADDGYRYKTVKRFRYRIRRDVNELANNDYLPPAEETPAEEAAPVEAAPAEAAQDSAVLADDGYRYKTVKRYRYRVRRDVNELANNDYLPPAEDTPAEEAAPVEAAPAEAAQDSAVLADDGYRYKTVKRYRYRVRRDVNELANNDYLPPAEETQAEEAAPVEAAPAEAAQDSAVLADDGYRYKTVKRFRYRIRRDVNELANNDYLPPAEETPAEEAAPVEAAPAEAAQDSAVLADDGYRYKTVKRYRYRVRRDVNELANNDYLPPAEETQAEEAAPVEAAPAEAAQDSAVLADDGYRYKTVKRFRYRIRRDVNELANNDYLPPAEETPAEEAAPVEAAPAESAQDSAVLADDGYRYKTVKRYRYRVRRDVNELANNDYLPPAEDTPAEEAAPVEAAPAEAAQDSAVLADDGYRYKTVKRFRYRVRRDVNELANNDYLPPAEETQAEEAAAVEAAPAEAEQDSAVLANDGYQYKTVKRVVYRRRV